MLKKSGFTLIELLVTITIIAILSAIGLVIFSTVMRQGRDSKRMSDLRSIQSALEQYYSDQGFYPSRSIFRIDLQNGAAFTSSRGNPSPPSPVKIYMNSLPQDPTGSLIYIYDTFTSDGNLSCANDAPVRYCVSYCLYAHLENQPTSLPTPPTYCTQSLNLNEYNFLVAPP